MSTLRRRARYLVVLFMGLALAGGRVSAMDKPSQGELARYQRNGTLDDRLAFAEALGNHYADPALVLEFETRLATVRLRLAGRTDAEIDQILPTMPSGIRPGLASKGTSRIFALLLDFSDYPASITPASVDIKLFADGDGTGYPYESLRNYYRRSSNNLLEIQGATLGWYRPAYTRASISQTTAARENLIKEALNYFHSRGHNFSQYDNNNDGVIDYFCVFWTGPDNGWANFWWGYYTSWGSSFTLDGKQFQASRYSWQYVLRGTTAFAPRTVIHETGHSLGLPDLYDYDTGIGVAGGVGGLDMMDANWGDHNAFSKMLLDWLTPQVRTSGKGGYALGPSGNAPDALILWPSYSLAAPFTEFFIVQRRTRVDNDSTYPADGLLVWHIDATLGGNNFLYNNSYTPRKLVRLMEADGLEEIEQRRSANAGDFYTAGTRLAPGTTPSSQSYSGAASNVFVDGIADAGASFFAAFVNAPSNLTGQRQVNRSLTQSEQVVDLRWSPNPANASLVIAAHRVYRLSDSTWTRVAEVPASQLDYRNRKVPKTSQTYGVTVVTSDGLESDKVTVVK
jgi:M6 family metalloprotease-like protein